MPPIFIEQFVFVIVDILFGLLLFATIVGSVGEMVTSMNRKRTEFESTQDGVKMYMEYRGVKRTLQRRIIRWFRYIWSVFGAL